MEYIAQALRNLLPNKPWKMNGIPANEQDFLAMFEIVTHVNEQRDAVYSTDPSDFGVTWAQVEAEVAELKAKVNA
jgi:hypothetical protein